jgi:hypothetical protein
LCASQFEVARSFEDAPYRFIGDAVIAGDLAQRLVILLDTCHDSGPLGRRNFPFGNLGTGVALEERL